MALYIGLSFSFYGLSLYCLVIALSMMAAHSLLYGFIVFAVFWRSKAFALAYYGAKGEDTKDWGFLICESSSLANFSTASRFI